MTARECRGDALVELYFYDELSDRERIEAEAHIACCVCCRESLAGLRAIEAALATPAANAPPAGDWSGFMRRLDARLDREIAASPARLRTTIASRWMKIAAALTLVATGMAAGWAVSRFTKSAPQQADSVLPGHPASEEAIADAGESGLARARVVLAGLAQKQDGATWSLERGMAAALLPEVRLIRQAAADRGSAGLEDILTDVEMLLLQASYAESDDAETLARLRGMIDRGDMLMRLSAATDGSAASRARSRKGV